MNLTSTAGGEVERSDALEAIPNRQMQLPNFSEQRSVKGFGIRTKAIALATIFGVLPVLGVGAYAYRVAHNSIARQISLEKIAESKELANQLSHFLQEQLVDVQMVARVAGTVNEEVKEHHADDNPQQQQAIAKEELEKQLTAFGRNYNIYSYLGLYDIQGNEIVRAHGFNKERHQKNSYFQQVVDTGLPAISEPLVTNSAGYNIFSIYIAAPVKQISGKTTAIVVAKIPVSYVGDVVFGGVGLRKGTNFSIVNSSSQVFQNFGESERGSLGYKITEEVPRFHKVDTKRQSKAWIDNTDEGEVLQVYAPMKFEPIRRKGELNWSIITTTETAIAFAPQRHLLHAIGLGTLLAAAILTVLAAILANYAIQPVLQATAAVEKFGQGDLDTRIQIQGNDELAVLAININKMAEQIQTLLTNLQENAIKMQQQNEQVVQESQVLQADVSNLLDVVSAVEEGNLTVQAPMSDRVTGLVADTLNRLIEELASIIFEVQSQAQQTAENATDLQNLATVTVQQAQQQAQSVSEVKSLMVNVTALSQGAAQQALVADEAVQQAQEAAIQGQQEMETMTDGIATLQQGTDQIIRRVQTLTEFVKLAAQFTQGQKRVATMTRVLALNASTLVARAAGQEDPEQFASIAREFETIANQVNELATQTSQSLILLQQRTDQIQTVVSGLNRDVQEIGHLVVNFTGGVEQSRQAFNNITTITEQVAQVGQQVSQSSQAIAEVAQTTLRSIQDIATAADTTKQQAGLTLGQSQAVGQAAYTLLELVRFFRLSTEPNQDGLAREDGQIDALGSNDRSASTLPMLTTAFIK